MSGNDRGEDRRRLLRAVRSETESESASEQVDVGDRPEPAPYGGTVALDAPPVRCTSCDRPYPAAPDRCDDCGSASFVPANATVNEDAE